MNNENLEIFNLLKSNTLFFVLLGITILLIFLLIILNFKKDKWMKWIGIPSIIVGLIFVLIGALTKNMFMNVLKEEIEGMESFVSAFSGFIFNNILFYGVALLCVGIALIVIYIIRKNKQKKELA